MNTNDLVTLQAYAIYIPCTRMHDKVRTFWDHAGLAMRIPFALGLHRYGTQCGLTRYEPEMRRRLWWEIHHLVTRAGEE